MKKTLLAIMTILSANLAFAGNVFTLYFRSIHNVVRNGNSTQVQQLLNIDPTVINKQDLAGRTPLHLSILFYDTKTFHVLIEGGAELNLTDMNGLTPLHYLVALNPSDMLRTLVARGPELNIGDRNGYTPLHVAAKNFFHIETIQSFIAAGANINQTTIDGETPLHVAARSNNTEIVRALIEAGASTYAVNSKNKTPQQLSRKITSEKWNELNELADLILCRDLLDKLNQVHAVYPFILPPKDSLQRIALIAAAGRIQSDFDEYQTRLQGRVREAMEQEDHRSQ